MANSAGTLAVLLGLAAAAYAVSAGSAIFDGAGGTAPDAPGPDNPNNDLWAGQVPTTETTVANPAYAAANYKINDYPIYATAIAAAEQQYGMPTDLLARQLFKESGYNPAIIDGRISSTAGAQGIAQFMPATARGFGINPLDPFQAIPAAARYMRQLYDQFGNWYYALMAYNWGPGNLDLYLRGVPTSSGKPRTIPQETAFYVATISADVNIG